MRYFALILFSIIFLCIGVLPVSAATFIVNSTADAVDTSLGDGVCETAPGNRVCTLRAAIQEANALPGADEIIVSAGTYLLTIPGQDENAAATGDLDIRTDLTITGAGADVTIIDGNGLDRVFHVFPPVFGNITVTISGVTVRNGDCRASDCVGGAILNHNVDAAPSTLTLRDCAVLNSFSGTPGAGFGGGGIYTRGTLTVTNCTISGNTGGWGGGINNWGTLTVTGSTISGNTGFAGGGIFLFGTVSVTDSVISNNRAEFGGGIDSGATVFLRRTTVSGNRATVGNGGGIRARGAEVIEDSTINGNISSSDGGGIAMEVFNIMTVKNSTISGNAAYRSGGGIAKVEGWELTLNGVTIANNVADYDDDGFGNGGGIAGRGGINFRNTIIAGNTDRNRFAQAPDCSGTLTSQGHNLIQNTAGCTIGGDLTGNITGADPRLGPLSHNGGPTKTHALLAGSPAIDAGDYATCEATDQRGVARPVGAACDIGAFEGVLEAPAILTESPLLNQIGVFSADPLEATGGLPPYAWSVIDGVLPAGMNLSAVGILSGTPTQLGSFTFTVRVTDSANNAANKTLVKEVFLTPPPQVRVDKFGTRPVPGREVTYFILVRNVGRGTATNYQVSEFLEPWFTFRSADPAPLSVEGDIILWNMPPLAPGDISVFVYRVILDAATPLGTIVSGDACSGKDLEKIEITCKELFPIDPVARGACRRSKIDACDTAKAGAQGAIDPNEKGAIAQRFIRPDQPLVYPIHFENIGTIEARDVFVTDVLDPNLDASTVQILTPGGTFNAATRTVRWDLLGINLPPGQSDNVLMAVKPLPRLPSGTEIRNRADIRFEVFETFTTNEVVNIIDTTPPICTMNPLPSIGGTPSFPISWSGSDAIGEIASYTILVSVDGGGFTPLLNRTTGTSALFNGAPGTYGFICVATDTAGNIEAQSLIAEATTTIVANRPPVARCQDVTVSADASCQGSASVNKGSSDPDGGLLTLSQLPAGPYSLGFTPTTLTVTDNMGASSSCSATVAVVDQTQPAITCPRNHTAECTGPNGAPVSFSLTASDNCSATITPSCALPSGSIFPLGITLDTCTAIDGAGNQSTCSFNVNVVDTTAPVVQSMTARPNVLWPPNHQMVAVIVTLSASDRCDSAPSCRITSISSNEPVDGLGDGDAAPDWEITGNLAVKLRAERSGKGSGRVYTITAMCADASGNSSTKTTTVNVPHDQRKK